MYTERYGYDLVGNLNSKAGVTYQYSSSAHAHALTNDGSTGYSYDASGNLSSGGTRTYAWNAENLPTSITSGGTTETYGYDADGARITKTRAGATTLYLEGLWEETLGQRVKTYYTFNGKAVALRDSTDTTNYPAYIHGDHLGSVSVVTNSTGGTVSQEFDPWGKVRAGGTSATKRNFTGQYLDDTGLLFYNARYYDPAIGRFLSADTVVPNPGNPQDFNRYAYVNNNPVNRTDPTGHFPDNNDPINCYCTAYAAGRPTTTSGRALRNPLNVAAPTFIAAGAAAGTAVGSIDTESGSGAPLANSDQMGGRTAPNPSAPTPPPGSSPDHFDDLGREWRDNGTRGSFRQNEADLARRLEQQVGRLERYNPNVHPANKYGDWIDSAGKTYDGIGPVNSKFFNVGSFTKQIDKHLLKQGVDYTVVDLTGLDAAQSASVRAYINSLTHAQQSQIMVIGP